MNLPAGSGSLIHLPFDSVFILFLMVEPFVHFSLEEVPHLTPPADIFRLVSDEAIGREPQQDCSQRQMDVSRTRIYTLTKAIMH